ncbi:ubiquitin-conjugating enzyme E2 T-like [Pollicipes pollicipes]|uniref:ubiquitin-conjugating enzyme E2 T-like n=1 Tax=Pollicipes pollicipes TaxID=41117 RepID=UPI0018856D80|nr:ubiquitin-conjugating enzyme E2 T-like [Pollicipes pollicipes]
MSIRLLLAEPNPDDPLMPDVAQEYRLRRPEYERKAAEMTAKHAIPKAVLGSIENRARSAGAEPPSGQPVSGSCGAPRALRRPLEDGPVGTSGLCRQAQGAA